MEINDGKSPMNFINLSICMMYAAERKLLTESTGGKLEKNFENGY